MGKIQCVAQGDILEVRRGSNKKSYFAQTKSGRSPQLRSVTAALGIISKDDALIVWAIRLNNQCIKAQAEALLGRVLTADALDAVLDHASEEFERVRWQAADIGTEVHRLIERWLQCEWDGIVGPRMDDLRPEVQNCLRLFWRWWEGKGLRVVDAEQIVWHGAHGYAGTLDFVCELPDGRLALIDWKSSKGVWPEMYLQVAAYYYALIEMGYKPEDFGEVTILRIGKEDAQFEPVPIPLDMLPIAYKAFYCCLRLTEILSEIKSLDTKRWKAWKAHCEKLASEAAREVQVPF